MKVSVVVPTRDRPRELASLLSSLTAQTLKPDEVIIVDAGGAPIPRQTYDGPLSLTHIRSEPNVGRQRNIGAKAASGDLVVFLDDDVLPEADFLAVMSRTFETHPEFAGGMGTLPPTTRRASLGAVLCRLFQLQHEFGDGSFYWSGMPRHPYGTSRLISTRVMGGGLMAVRRRTLETTAVEFDEEMEHSQEDADFSLRLSRRAPLFFNPEARVEHTASAAGRPDAFEGARRYMASYRYLYAKNFFSTAPWTLPFHWWALVGMFVTAALTASPAVLSGYVAALRRPSPR